MNLLIKFFLDHKVITILLLVITLAWGLIRAPFDWNIKYLPHDPIAVDAIPNIGENQQIVFTEWQGHSPQDIEDQITYPLTTALLGIPYIKSIRSNSMFGFSSIYLIFEDEIDFYWSRTRILEKLNALPPNLLPENVSSTLGPDATGLGQIFWYTLEGRDENGDVTGGWDLHDLRSIQDFYVRYGLSSAKGVAEVASIGGFVKEYQIDIRPDKMRIYEVGIDQLVQAVKGSNVEIGLQTLEINLAEYFIRSLGYVSALEDIEESVVKVQDNIPIRVRDLAYVSLGPAARRGVLDKEGNEAVGGVVIARYGANPLEVIEAIKSKIKELTPGLPSKTLVDGRRSQVQIIPFYDRTRLIKETIGTLEEALSLEIIITIIVVVLMLFNLNASLLISSILPIAVLGCFIMMHYWKVEANLVALSGIAIAIGTMVDMGIVLIENITRHLKRKRDNELLRDVLYKATTEVAPAILTALATTIISFLPVFTMEASEGKLFKPLALTKTFALLASLVVVLTILPTLASFLFKTSKMIWHQILLFAASTIALFSSFEVIGGLGFLVLGFQVAEKVLQVPILIKRIKYILYAFGLICLLTNLWMPLGVAKSWLLNLMFVASLIGILMGFFYTIYHFYESILRFFLKQKLIFITLIISLLVFGVQIFRKIGQEFMPALDEGAFLLMPTAMPHTGMQVNVANLRLLDLAVTAIPEVETVVGKAGRVNSALDPAPMSMYENLIIYKSEYKVDQNGRRLRFKVNSLGQYLRDSTGQLIPDNDGQYFRQWRQHIHSPDDIWQEIIDRTHLPGLTSAPKLQPIQTRLVMLQTGMRAPMGIKVKGNDLKSIEAFGLELESELKTVEGVKASAVFAERLIGKPYLLLEIDRSKISPYGLRIIDVQRQIQAAVGGIRLTTTIEGRERYHIRIRYPRELRDQPEKLKRIYITTATGTQIPLAQIMTIKYEKGPQNIKSEDGFLVAYVLFDKAEVYSETQVVQKTRQHLETKIKAGKLIVPSGISFEFAGNYEQQVRANRRLAIILPLALTLILIILYLQFRSVLTALIIFLGVFVAFAGGFIMIGLYGQDYFLNFDLLDVNLRTVFQIKPIYLSVAVWVGFLALFGIATDDGVLISTFLQQQFKITKPKTRAEIQEAIVQGGLRRIKPALMTTATTLIALLPILTSTGKGADIMIPMAIPTFGGMLLQTLTLFTVPVFYALWKENSRLFELSIQTINYQRIKSLFLKRP